MCVFCCCAVVVVVVDVVVIVVDALCSHCCCCCCCLCVEFISRCISIVWSLHRSEFVALRSDTGSLPLSFFLSSKLTRLHTLFFCFQSESTRIHNSITEWIVRKNIVYYMCRRSSKNEKRRINWETEDKGRTKECGESKVRLLRCIECSVSIAYAQVIFNILYTIQNISMYAPQSKAYGHSSVALFSFSPSNRTIFVLRESKRINGASARETKNSNKNNALWSNEYKHTHTNPNAVTANTTWNKHYAV